MGATGATWFKVLCCASACFIFCLYTCILALLIEIRLANMFIQRLTRSSLPALRPAAARAYATKKKVSYLPCQDWRKKSG